MAAATRSRKDVPLTCQLHDRRTVLAESKDGRIRAKTYANRTQAKATAGALGTGWDVIHPGRPFYVVKSHAES